MVRNPYEIIPRAGYTFARGFPQIATGLVDLFALPLTMTGIARPEDIFLSTDYLTKRGYLPTPEMGLGGLVGETGELLSSAISPGAVTKSAILAGGGLLADAARLSGADLTPFGEINVPGLLGQTDRLARAKELGFDTDRVMYHGSTFDIKEFGGEPNPENAYGSGYYFTSNPEDASINYAGEGADLTNRIEQRAEELSAYNDEIPFDEAKELARQELKGEAEAVVYPVYLNVGNSFDVRANGTNPYLESEFPDPFEQEGADYWLKQTDGDIDEARELAEEAKFDYEPEGTFVDFYESVMNNYDMSSSDKETFANEFSGVFYEGISAKELDERFRKLEIYPGEDEGKFTKMEVFRKALEDAGFDSIQHDADRFNMQGTEGADHTIIFNPKNIRSTQGQFDPNKVESRDILSSNQMGLLNLV